MRELKIRASSVAAHCYPVTLQDFEKILRKQMRLRDDEHVASKRRAENGDLYFMIEAVPGNAGSNTGPQASTGQS